MRRKYTPDTLTLSLFSGHVCVNCLIWLPFDLFGKTKGKPIGTCKACKKEQERANLEYISLNHPERIQQIKERRANYNREWMKRNRIKKRIYTNTRRTRKTEAGGSYTVDEWLDLCWKFRWHCLRCGKQTGELCADHVKPVSKGGSSNIDNIQPLCKPCNTSKRDKEIDYRETFVIPAKWL